jgi:hypothetical protein
VTLRSVSQRFEDELRAADTVVQLVGTEVVGEACIRLIPLFFGPSFRGKLNIDGFH